LQIFAWIYKVNNFAQFFFPRISVSHSNSVRVAEKKNPRNCNHYPSINFAVTKHSELLRHTHTGLQARSYLLNSPNQVIPFIRVDIKKLHYVGGPLFRPKLLFKAIPSQTFFVRISLSYPKPQGLILLFKKPTLKFRKK
jgi:hypothetical protein